MMEVVEKLHDGAAQKMEIKQSVESNLASPVTGLYPGVPIPKQTIPCLKATSPVPNCEAGGSGAGGGLRTRTDSSSSLHSF